MKTIIFCAHSSFEYFLCVSIFEKLKFIDNDISAEMIVPEEIKSILPLEWIDVFSNVYGLTFPRITFAPLSDLRSALKFSRFLSSMCETPDVVFSAAWRSTATNMLAKRFKSGSRFVATVNGAEPNLSFYTKRPFFRGLYRKFFDTLWGVTELKVLYQAGDQNHAYAFWKKDPVDLLIEFSERGGVYSRPNANKTVSLSYPFRRVCQSDNPFKTLLFIGERTPLFEDVVENNDQSVQMVLDHIRCAFRGWKLLFRPRPGYTRIELLDLTGFELVSGESSLEYELYSRRPDFLLSAKSTASKFAWSVNIPSAVFYPVLDLPKHYMSLLDSFFDDAPSLPRISSLSELTPDKLKLPDAQLEGLADQFFDIVFGSEAKHGCCLY
tara:strand:+ start:19078 stop:20220 length:1143 start_codon:yes stop_codon:yes gene_type:complete